MEEKKQSWIKVFRSFKDHWLYDTGAPFTKKEAWLDILLNVNYEPKKKLIGEALIDCNAGQCLFSLSTWAKRWRWDKSKVRRFFKLLEADNMVVTENVHKTTRLTVCKWGSYQNKRNGSETEVKRIRNASETQVTPTKEGKERKERKEYNSETEKLKFSELLNFLKFKDQLLNDEIWLNSICLLFEKQKLKPEQIENYIDQFGIIQNTRKYPGWSTDRKFSEHFQNWLSLQYKNLKEGKSTQLEEKVVYISEPSQPRFR